MNDITGPFLYTGGQHTGALAMRRSSVRETPKPYTTDLGGIASLSMNAEHANAYLLSIVEALYDNGDLAMATAERLTYLAQAVLADNEQVPCPSCNGSGQTGAPWDPESCTGCRGTGSIHPQAIMTRDEYDAFIADTQTEEA